MYACHDSPKDSARNSADDQIWSMWSKHCVFRYIQHQQTMIFLRIHPFLVIFSTLVPGIQTNISNTEKTVFGSLKFLYILDCAWLAVEFFFVLSVLSESRELQLKYYRPPMWTEGESERRSYKQSWKEAEDAEMGTRRMCFRSTWGLTSTGPNTWREMLVVRCPWKQLTGVNFWVNHFTI